MTFEAFRNKVFALIRKSGEESPVVFRVYDDKYYAEIDDVTIIGRSGSLKVTVRYGSGHQAMAVL